jgi:hypothetical protein
VPRNGFFRTRLPWLLVTWLATVLVVVAGSWVASRLSFYRPMGRIAVAAGIAIALVVTWELLRGRSGEDRREAERREKARRAGEG